jgi:hypothetical protein
MAEWPWNRKRRDAGRAMKSCFLRYRMRGLMRLPGARPYQVRGAIVFPRPIGSGCVGKNWPAGASELRG